MAVNMAFVGGERQINRADPNDTDGDNQINGLFGPQSNAEVTALANGHFVVAFQSRNEQRGDLDIMSVEYDANGNAVGSAFNIVNTAAIQINPDVVPHLKGYAVVWEDYYGGNAINFAVVEPGDLTPFTFVAAAFDFETVHDPSVAMFANGTHIVTYTRDDNGNLDTLFTLVDARGDAFVDSPVEVGRSVFDESNTAVATSGNTAAIVYLDESLGGASSDGVRMTLVNSSGTVVGAAIISDIGAELAAPDVTTLADGRFLIVWQNLVTGVISGRIYDPAVAGFSGAEFVIGDADNQNALPRAAALKDGGFLVTWTDDVRDLGDGSASAIHGQRFDSAGAPAGDEFRLNVGVNAAQNDAAIAVNASGVVFSAWTNSNTNNTADNSPTGIQGRLLKAVTDMVNGTAGDDTITTYSLAETISAFGGKDTVDGRGGSDRISGGEGKDALTGGAGPDSFVFDVAVKKANRDVIADFVAGEDRLALDDAVFAKLKVAGPLKAKFFGTGKEAGDKNDFILYDKKSGVVSYDPDGSKDKHDPVAFAKLLDRPKLQVDDIDII